MRSFRTSSIALALLAGSACVRETTAPVMLSRGAVHAAGASAAPDPTVLGPRLVPETIDDEKTFGVEPGGGLRAIASGVRVVSLPSGAVLAAEDRLPSAPALTTALPERLGGGFLFVIDRAVWRADRWLAPAHPIFGSNASVVRVIPGLDRVYLRASTGAYQAIDPRSGALLDLGPWPGSSFVGGYAAADGWRAVAVDDLRGVVATFDAGATWRPLRLPIDARDVVVLGDAIAVGGQDAARATTWFEIRGDGQIGRMAGGPPAPAPPAERSLSTPLEGATKSFGRRPLLAAIEDGWPLSDGTALVARDGTLGRVRLTDGALVEVATDAYPLKPSRCHPLLLSRGPTPGAFGFVCGEPRGATALYAYDAPSGRMVEARRFDAPRLVLSSGNGALAVRGPCAPAGVDDDPTTMHAYCTRSNDEVWREIHVRGEIGGERVVVLGDGRFVIVSPPQGDLATARLTILDAGQHRSIPIRFPQLTSDVLRVLKVGVWLDGFEERRPGIIGGWIEAGGSMLGVEFALDGRARVGEFVREAGSPMVSGRYGLGWTPSRRGYETLDGGMSWAPIDVPEPIAPPRLIASRACGPVGCSAAGWLRVGWGPSMRPPLPEVRPVTPPFAYAPRTSLALTCEATSPPLPPARTAAGAARSTESIAHVFGGPPSQTLPAFYNFAPPSLRTDERGLSYEASDLLGRHAASVGPVARVYAWGPRSGEWEHSSRWLARWLWPYGGPADARASQSVAAPPILLEAARFGGGPGSVMIQPTWSVALGDDASHALIVARRSARADAVLYELESDRAPIEIRRADGDPFTEIDAALRAAGRWYIATPPAPGELMVSIVWQVDGPIAREIARIPRAGMEARPIGAHLARRSDGRMIALVVDGQPSATRAGATRWALPIDLDTGALGDPESLGAADLGDRTALPICDDDFAGWVLDTPLSIPVMLHATAQPIGALMPSSTLARVRVTGSAACVERLSGSLADSYAIERLAPPLRSAIRAEDATLGVSVFASRTRHALRCAPR